MKDFLEFCFNSSTCWMRWMTALCKLIIMVGGFWLSSKSFGWKDGRTNTDPKLGYRKSNLVMRDTSIARRKIANINRFLLLILKRQWCCFKRWQNNVCGYRKLIVCEGDFWSIRGDWIRIMLLLWWDALEGRFGVSAAAAEIEEEDDDERWCSRRLIERLILPKGIQTHDTIALHPLIVRRTEAASNQWPELHAESKKSGMHTVDDAVSLQHNINCRMMVVYIRDHLSTDVMWSKAHLYIITNTTICS